MMDSIVYNEWDKTTNEDDDWCSE